MATLIAHTKQWNMKTPSPTKPTVCSEKKRKEEKKPHHANLKNTLNNATEPEPYRHDLTPKLYQEILITTPKPEPLAHKTIPKT